MPTITFLAGSFVHQATAQARFLADHAPAGYEFAIFESAEALEHLAGTDVLVVSGLFWTGSTTVTWTTPERYVPPTEAQREGLRAYVRRGGAILGLHGGIASFNDWPEFGTLLGFAWNWHITTHGPIKDYTVNPCGEPHPVRDGIESFHIHDENYYGLQLCPGVPYATHLKMDCGDVQLPMLLTTEGGRAPGAGRAAYFALGHDERATTNPAFQRLFWNCLGWLAAGR